MGKILIVEPSDEQCDAIVDALGGVHALRICKEVGHARSLLSEFKPHVLLLSLQDMEGLLFLQELDSQRPQILVCTPCCNQFMVSHLENLCDRILFTPCNLAQLRDHVSDLLAESNQIMPAFHGDAAAGIVRQLLQRPARDGYKYLISAINRYTHDPRQAVTKELYPAIAKEFGTNAACVEKAIRSAIKQAYFERNDAVWRRYFPTNRNGQVILPSNKDFFVLMAAHIQSQRRA